MPAQGKGARDALRPSFCSDRSARSIKLPRLMKKRLRFYVLWSFLLIVLAVAATVGAAWHLSLIHI